MILYVTKTFKHGIGDPYQKGTYLLMAEYRKPWFLGKEPVEFVSHFQMFWGARSCVLNLTKKEMLEWISDGRFNFSSIMKFIIMHN